MLQRGPQLGVIELASREQEQPQRNAMICGISNGFVERCSYTPVPSLVALLCKPVKLEVAMQGRSHVALKMPEQSHFKALRRAIPGVL